MACFTLQAQRKFSLGINAVPISAGSIELVAEHSLNRLLSLSFKGGYAFEDGLRFILKADDGIDNKKHSGYFVKAGIKLYPYKGIFLTANVIYSNYVNSGERLDAGGNTELLTSRGGIWALGLTPGYRINIDDSPLSILVGLQVGIAQSRNDLVGIQGHNYQPGLGPVGNTYCQPMVAFILKL
ncbi:hypothetical protein BKI52_27695 [marine bacterium AO1-C]|nr:hypothetical protein BKI52_27695 [marine bacterium AO1-C]